MVEAARLAVVVTSDTSDLEAGVKRAHGALTSFGTGAASALSGIASAAAAPAHALAMLGLAANGLGVLGGAIGSIATGMVAGNAQMETYETQLGTLLGSADKAKERLAELAKFGAETPFELPEVVRAEKVLLGFGLTGQKAVQLTGKSATELRTIIGDVAAGTGASFEEIALNFGKFSAGATGEAISRLQELGIVTREQMTAMGVQFSAAGELISPLPKAMEVAVKIAQQKFGGGMDALSKTFAGQMSTLSDNFNQAKNVVTQPIFDVLKKAVAGLNDVMSSGGFQATLQKVGALLAGVVQQGVALATSWFQRLLEIGQKVGAALPVAFAQIASAFSQVMTVVGPLAERITTFFSSLAAGATLATTVNRAFGDLIPAGLNPILDAVDGAFNRIKTTATDLVAVVQGEGLAGVWKRVQETMADFAPTGERIASVVASITDAIAALVPQPIKEFVASLFASGQAAGAGVDPVKALADAVNAVSGAVATAVRWLKDNEIVLYAVAGAAAALAAVLVVQQAAQLAVTVATTAATAAQWLLNAALTANPIGIVVVALGALAGALIYAYTHSETFRKIVDDTFAVLKAVVMDAITVATGLITDFGLLLDALGRTMQSLASTASAAFARIMQAITSAWTVISAATTSTWTEIKDFLEPIWAALESAATVTFGVVRDAVVSAMATAAGAVSGQLDAIRGFFERARDAITGIVNAIKDTVERVFGGLISTATDAKNQMQSILDTVTGWLNSIKGMVAQAAAIFASRPSGPSGGGGSAPAAPAMPGVPAPPAEPGMQAVPDLSQPGGGFSVRRGSASAETAVMVQIVMPNGAYYGSLADFARELKPELDRLISVRAL